MAIIFLICLQPQNYHYIYRIHHGGLSTGQDMLTAQIHLERGAGALCDNHSGKAY